MTRTPRETDHGKRPAGTPFSRATSALRGTASIGRLRGSLRGKSLIFAGVGLAIAGAGVATVTAGVSATAPSQADALRAHRFAFLHAPALHPAIKAVMPVRRALGVRTVFNVLGPLTNPAGARTCHISALCGFAL